MKSLVNMGLNQMASSPKLLAMMLSCLITAHAAAAILSSTTPLITACASQTATLISDGSLLIAGGQTNGGFTSSSMLQPSFGSGGVTLSCAGVQGVSFRVQRAPTLAGPWTTIATVTIGESGIGTCIDPAPNSGNAFYRAAYP